MTQSTSERDRSRDASSANCKTIIVAGDADFELGWVTESFLSSVLDEHDIDKAHFVILEDHALQNAIQWFAEQDDNPHSVERSETIPPIPELAVPFADHLLVVEGATGDQIELDDYADWDEAGKANLSSEYVAAYVSA